VTRNEECRAYDGRDRKNDHRYLEKALAEKRGVELVEYHVGDDKQREYDADMRYQFF
jgi:hypothetical protein